MGHLAADSPFSFSFHKNINLTSTGICIYYDNVAKAFQNGDPEALANMFDDKITDPMSKDEIFAWAKGLFAQYGSATFEVEKLVLEHYDNKSAITLLTYRVITSKQEGSFGGTERDYLTKLNESWLVSRWEQLPQASPN